MRCKWHTLTGVWEAGGVCVRHFGAFWVRVGELVSPGARSRGVSYASSNRGRGGVCTWVPGAVGHEPASARMVSVGPAGDGFAFLPSLAMWGVSTCSQEEFVQASDTAAWRGGSVDSEPQPVVLRYDRRRLAQGGGKQSLPCCRVRVLVWSPKGTCNAGLAYHDGITSCALLHINKTCPDSLGLLFLTGLGSSSMARIPQRSRIGRFRSIKACNYKLSVSCNSFFGVRVFGNQWPHTENLGLPFALATSQALLLC